MPSILRQTIGALKDQTSISFAKLSKRSSSLDVAVLKTTSHEDGPIDERYLADILFLSSSSPSAAAACVRALSRRIARTSNWVVAVKALVVTHRLLRQGGSKSIHDAIAAPAGTRRLLDLSAFRDRSSASSPWDFTAFVRTFAFYLHARLESALLGKFTRIGCHPNVVADMKPPVILDQIELCQKLLDRGLGTRPTGPAKDSRLVHIALYLVVFETFSLYRDISSGLTLLLENFFHLPHAACVKTYEVCTKARNQFEELESFYDLCKKIGVGRSSEYPNVQMISGNLVEELEDFLMKTAPNSHASTPKADSKSSPQQLACMKLQHKFMAEEPKAIGGRGSMAWTISDGSQLQVIPRRRRNISDEDEQCIVKDVVFNSVGDKQNASASATATDSDLDAWEVLLVKSINNSPDDKLRDVKRVASESMISMNSIANQPESFHYNPFLHGSDEGNLPLIQLSPPRSQPIPSPPTFCAGPAKEEKHRVLVSGQTNEDLTRQQRVLREQQLWMEQQSKIIEKRLAR